MQGKIAARLEEIDQWVGERRFRGERIGFTCGTFDLIHAGHVAYLRAARAECDALLVAVNTDDSVRRYKNPLRPVNRLEHRMAVLAALESVSAVCAMEDDRPLRLIERWKPELYVKGGDYPAEKLRSARAVAAYGGRTLVIPVEQAVSTTSLMERIQALERHAAPERVIHRGGPVVLLDRDGTLIENVPFLHDPERVKLREGVLEGLRAMAEAGARFAIVTNQQGLGLGYFNLDQFIAVNQRLLRELGRAGIAIEKIYYCPHTEGEFCECRKPKPGLLLRAMREMDVEAGQCFYIGDTAVDEEAGRRAGVATCLVGAADFRDVARRVLAGGLRRSGTESR